jgi:hypothetical protein
VRNPSPRNGCYFFDILTVSERPQMSPGNRPQNAAAMASVAQNKTTNAVKLKGNFMWMVLPTAVSTHNTHLPGSYNQHFVPQFFHDRRKCLHGPRL